jgi:hypothetical protein
MIDPVIALTVLISLELLLLGAAWHKLSDPRRFVSTVRAYELVPEPVAPALAALFPVLELCIAAGLLYAPSRPSSATLLLLLLTVYTGAIAINLARGKRDIDCGCFAASTAVPLSARLTARNLLLAGATSLLLLSPASRPLLWVDVLSIAMATVTLVLLWQSARGLAATAPSLQRSGGPR